MFQAQQRILSSSSGPQRGGTLEVAQSLQSPACEAPEGNLWVWSALDTRLQFPASSPIPCSPQVLLSIPDRPEEAEAAEARRGGNAVWSWGATNQSAPLFQAQQGFLMGNWEPEKMRQRWGKTSAPCPGETLIAKAQISLPRRVEGNSQDKD